MEMVKFSLTSTPSEETINRRAENGVENSYHKIVCKSFKLTQFYMYLGGSD